MLILGHNRKHYIHYRKCPTMKKIILLISILLALTYTANAQITVSYEKGLERILPGDEVLSYLVIYNPNLHAETIQRITFYSDKVYPRMITDVGTIPPKSEYRLPFTFRSDKAGTYTIHVRVKTLNGSVSAYLPFKVIEDYPKLRIDSSELVMGQKNILKVYVEWDSNVTLRPLFNASPSESFGKSFEFVLYPEKRENLTFEIEFRNGDNVHVIQKSVEVDWVEEKGVIMNITSSSTAYRNEAVPVGISVTNLNSYRVENLVLLVGDRTEKISFLDPGETWKTMLYIPAEKEIGIMLEYRNQLGRKYAEKEVLKFSIIDENVVQLCSYEFERDLLSGQVCNFGSTEVKNVMVRFGNESYFIGTVMPEDYEVFSIKTNRTEGTVQISWKNLAGSIESASQKVEGKAREKVEIKSGNELLIASAVIALVVVALAIIALRRR